MKKIDVNINTTGIESVIMSLYHSDKRELAHRVLEHLFEKSSNIHELDLVGSLCVKAEHRNLYVKCSEAAYAIATQPQQRYAARVNLIKAYGMINYPDKALDYIEIQLKINPNDIDILLEKVANLFLMNKKLEAETLLNEIKIKYPEKNKQVEMLLSGKYLRDGNLVKGIKVFIDAYKPNHKIFDEKLKMKRWDGIPKPGKIVYVNGEGGIGDEIANIRFIENIKKFGMKPILVSTDNKFHKDKNDMFRRHGIEISPETYSIDPKQYWVPAMSLPATLNLNENQLWTGPYLKPLRQEKNRISSNKFKIGIKCSGNPYFQQDEYRKIPIDEMINHLPADAELFYIDVVKKNHHRAIDLADRITSWEDTLDFIDQMDCIVSSCTSLVHAAGAIGKTTLVAIPFAEYYTWTSSRTNNSTPWYGENFYVFRQTKLRDWEEPLSKIYDAIENLRK